ncbi:hypothetical protein FHW79_002075 [Azospirillum sp. OGB3]|uniref:hypothetical protein n=1 Tax=Azospirillum sp. OGB3 TaxID=2587012 RepID=UPI0016061B99|nr:hypothetical protein [Azospirillum sp. OGB3]MBB3264460.1 hypothetical protein [Azospirillum sp. OGB3]
MTAHRMTIELDDVTISAGLVDGRPVAVVLSGGEALFQTTGEDVGDAVDKAHARLANRHAPRTSATTVPAPAAMATDGPGRVASGCIQVQPRTRRLPLPAFFCLEAGRELRPRLSGNADDGIFQGFHQVDPTRQSPMTPVMPNIARARASGNAYPARADETVVSSAAYRDLVMVSHAVYALLKERGTVCAQDIDGEVAERVSGRFTGPEVTKKVRPCVLDTLRDLRLFGLATAPVQGGFRRTTPFRFVDPHTVLLADATETLTA